MRFPNLYVCFATSLLVSGLMTLINPNSSSPRTKCPCATPQCAGAFNFGPAIASTGALFIRTEKMKEWVISSLLILTENFFRVSPHVYAVLIK